MAGNLSPRKPRFNAGDRVAVSQGANRAKTGTITEIPNSPFDTVYRYRVTFDDKTSGIFFGFEFERLRDEDEAANF